MRSPAPSKQTPMGKACERRQTLISEACEGGQTLIGVLIGLAILGILASALFTLTTTSYKLVATNKTKIAARHLAQKRIEVIRNMPYDQVGTLGGIPSGSLPQTETVELNGLVYTINTSIINVDDSFDQISPDDLLPTDYKRVRVDVGWEGPTLTRNVPVVLVTDVSPRGIETTQGGGTLSILVFDSNAQPVPQAIVTITAPSLEPAIDLILETNDNGRIVLPGSPECTECYNINSTKENFSTNQTHTADEVANPSKPPQSVIEGTVTEISFAIDWQSTLNISSTNDRESEFTTRPDTTFTLRGEKTIGTDINDFPVYKYEEVLTTDATGKLEVENLEWDNYVISLSGDSAISGINPLSPLLLLPNTQIDLDFAVGSSVGSSLLVAFTQSDTPIASVSATLSDDPSYSETVISGIDTDPDYGQVFFPNLEQLSYSMSATASGYLDLATEIIVDGNMYETISLEAE